MLHRLKNKLFNSPMDVSKKEKYNKAICRFWIIFIGFVLITSALFLYKWVQSDFYEVAGVPVLNYHQVNDKNYSPLTVQVQHFEQEMDYLETNGYHTITLDELYDYLTTGKELPEKPVVITFDDGYTDNYEYAFPILKEHGMKATLFMIGDSINTNRFLTSAQLIEMDRNGFSVEAHTYHHKNLKTLNKEEIDTDLKQSKEVLEQLLHKDIRYIAYPGGYNNSLVRTETKAAGFRMAFTVQPGNVQPGEDFYGLPRLAVFEGDNAFLSLVIRLHMASIVSDLWSFRDYLRDTGHTVLARFVPLF